MSVELWMINAKISDPQISLKEIKELWYEAKTELTSISQPIATDIEAAVEIFNKGIEKVGEFFIKWLDGKIQPTDEELDLLEQAFNEASWAFDFLSTDYPAICSTENNQGWQKKIKENKRIVSEEKSRRNQVKDLQSQLNSLQNQPKNGDNEAKIKDLQSQIEELKKSKPISPEAPQQSIILW